MSDKNEENILYGGPEPPIIDDESQSLGEVLLKKLTINANDVMFVSMSQNSKIKSIFSLSTKVTYCNECMFGHVK